MTTCPKNKLKGFSLLEVLISVLILSFGLLGLAGLQTKSLQQTNSAYMRSQATLLSSDIADRMRANIAGLSSYVTTEPEKAEAVSTCTTSAGCSPANMAQNDIYEWYLSMASILNSPKASVAFNSPVYTISISWDDDRDGDDDNNPVFVTSFSP